MRPEDNFDFAPLPEKSFEPGQFLAGAVAGAAIGAGLALLFAPRPGPEAREDIADAYAVLADRATDLLGDMRKRVASKLDEAHGRASEAVNEAKSAVEEWIAQSKGTIHDTRERLDGAVDAGREAYGAKRAELDAQMKAALID